MVLDGNRPKPPALDRADRPSWLVVAQAELGVKEDPSPTQSNPRIIEYYKATTLGGKPEDGSTPWCASFVCWVLEHAGFRSTRRANARSYLNFGMSLPASEDPPIGAIVVLAAIDRGPTAGHVGFWVGRWNHDQIWLLSGNSGNQVNVRLYGQGRVLGYRWPRDLDRKQ